MEQIWVLALVLLLVSRVVKIVLNEKVSLVRNYSVNHSAAWSPVQYAIINPLGSGSEIEINGADIAYNHGMGILAASNDCKVTINKTDIYYNETIGQRGAITLSGSLKTQFSQKHQMHR